MSIQMLTKNEIFKFKKRSVNIIAMLLNCVSTKFVSVSLIIQNNSNDYKFNYMAFNLDHHHVVVNIKRIKLQKPR